MPGISNMADSKMDAHAEKQLILFHMAKSLDCEESATAYKDEYTKAIRREAAKMRYGLIKKDGRCRICGCSSIDDLELHHIVPVSEFGDNNPENLVTLCKECHVWIHRAYDFRKHDDVKKWLSSGNVSSNEFTELMSKRLWLFETQYDTEHLLLKTIRLLMEREFGAKA